MPPLRTYNIFLSHSWSYSNAYEKLMALLDEAPNFRFKDYSIPKDDPVHTDKVSVLRQAIENHMRPCHIILIMAGVYSTYSKWINKEIEIANALVKPIIAIKPWGQTNLSQIVQNNADAIVGWNTFSVVSSIRELAI